MVVILTFYEPYFNPAAKEDSERIVREMAAEGWYGKDHSIAKTSQEFRRRFALAKETYFLSQ
jgi:hypothetical protein